MAAGGAGGAIVGAGIGKGIEKGGDKRLDKIEFKKPGDPQEEEETKQDGGSTSAA